METILIKTLQFIVALSLLIVLHEGGHFFFAKLFKTRVEKFYLFFDYKISLFSTYAPWFRRLLGKKPVPRRKDKDGKELDEYEYEGTEYGIGWIPLGGYVKISGMIDESMDKEQMKLPPQPWEFRTKPAWQRLLIMLGGIIVNFITAFVIYAMILFTWGEEYIPCEKMEYGMQFSEQAKEDGFRDGDLIIKIDDEKLLTWTDMMLQDVSNAKTVTVLRDGKETVINLPEKMNLLDMLGDDPRQRYATMLIPFGIDSVLPGTPAAEIGLEKGDKIISMNGKTIKSYNDFRNETFALQDILAMENHQIHTDSLKQRTVSLIVEKGETGRMDTVTTVLTSDFKIGFVPTIPYMDQIETREYGFFESFPAGIKRGWETLASYVDQMKYLFTKKGAKSMGGFVSIGNIFPSVWDWERFWGLTAFLSIALGFMNVLPIPALDGGHAVFAIYEIITKRKPSDKFLEKVQYIGMTLILILMLWANGNDLLRIFGIF